MLLIETKRPSPAPPPWTRWGIHFQKSVRPDRDSLLLLVTKEERKEFHKPSWRFISFLLHFWSPGKYSLTIDLACRVKKKLPAFQTLACARGSGSGGVGHARDRWLFTTPYTKSCPSKRNKSIPTRQWLAEAKSTCRPVASATRVEKRGAAIKYNGLGGKGPSDYGNSIWWWWWWNVESWTGIAECFWVFILSTH